MRLSQIISRLRGSQNLDEDFIRWQESISRMDIWAGLERVWLQNLFDTAYRVKPKRLITKPIRTKYGYHVIYLLK